MQTASKSEKLYAGLLAVTRKYLSDASVQAAVKTTLARRGEARATLTAANLPEVVAEAMVGLRLFCEPERLGDLMMDLAEYCEQVGAGRADPASGTAGSSSDSRRNHLDPAG